MSSMKFHELANIFPMMSASELAALRADIAKHGLREPIILAEGKIADGRNRYNACVELGVEPRFEAWDGIGSLVAFIVSMNLHRRHLNESQRAMVAAKLANMRQGARTDLQPSANLPEVGQPEAAQMLSVGERSLRSAKKVLTSGTPELARAVEQGKVAVSLAAIAAQLPEEKQIEFTSQVEAGEKPRNAYRKATQPKPNEIEMPDGKYRILYADPPWKYSDERVGLDQYGPAARHYPTMTIEELCGMGEQVKELAYSNSVLFLWVPSPILEDSFKVVGAWGFKYKTSFVWDKVRKNFGHYNAPAHEILLVCTRGSCTPDSDKKFDSVQSIERSDRHSEKPDEFRQIIDTLYTHGKRIELFARNEREGWEAWGNEV